MTVFTHFDESGETPESRPLSGIRVLDLTRYLPGPFCSRMLADLGAEVIKVEEPVAGDPSRHSFPALAGQDTLHAILNHGKKAVALNLKDPMGREVFGQLVAVSDVVLEGNRPGVAERLEIDYQRLSRIRPGLVYCSISGYSQHGRDALRAGHDLNYQARSGVLSLIADAAGNPVIPGIQLADLVGGLYALSAVLAALRLRDMTGQGQYCDVSLLASLQSLLATELAMALGNVPREPAAPRPLTGKLACYNLYRTGDGRYVSLSALEPKFWEAFCQRCGRPDWLDDFMAPERQERLRREVAAFFAEKPLDHWLEFFAGVDICMQPVATLEEVLGRDAGPGLAGAASLIRFPVSIGSTTGETSSPEAPALGRHNAEILGLLGYTPSEVEDFRARGIIN